jgi:hypothetical protein
MRQLILLCVPRRRSRALILLATATILGHDNSALGDEGEQRFPAVDCSDAQGLDDCGFLRCMCDGRMGGQVGEFVEDCYISEDGSLECACSCAYETENITCLGVDVGADYYGSTCAYPIVDLSQSGEACDTLWCDLSVDLAFIESVSPPAHEVEPLHDGLVVAIVEDAPPVMFVAEIEEQSDVQTVDSPLSELAAVCDAEGGSMLRRNDGSWVCCIPEYGCIICEPLTRSCHVVCQSRECRIDQARARQESAVLGESSLEEADQLAEPDNEVQSDAIPPEPVIVIVVEEPTIVDSETDPEVGEQTDELDSQRDNPAVDVRRKKRYRYRDGVSFLRCP